MPHWMGSRQSAPILEGCGETPQRISGLGHQQEASRGGVQAVCMPRPRQRPCLLAEPHAAQKPAMDVRNSATAAAAARLQGPRDMSRPRFFLANVLPNQFSPLLNDISRLCAACTLGEFHTVRLPTSSASRTTRNCAKSSALSDNRFSFALSLKVN